MPEITVRHPAVFSAAILEQLNGLVPPGVYLDPFAGIGKVYELSTAQRDFFGVEIEPAYAALHEVTMEGDATDLSMFGDGEFDGVVTSPCYGNRFADHHNAKDTSERRGYTHDLRTMLNDDTAMLQPGNAGIYYFWQPEYRELHQRAWAECARVTRDDGWMFLNVSDFIHRGSVQRVVAWHVGALKRVGYQVDKIVQVKTPRMRRGSNHEARVEAERIIVARKKGSL